jgi:hypothetical protein
MDGWGLEQAHKLVYDYFAQMEQKVSNGIKIKDPDGKVKKEISDLEARTVKISDDEVAEMAARLISCAALPRML